MNPAPPYPRILVCGGRDYYDEELVHQYLDALEPLVLIHGAARGADTFAANWAKDHVGKVTELAFPVSSEDWARHGKRAGMLRNQAMLDEGGPNLVLAFFPGGPGTRMMVELAQRAGVEVWQLEARPDKLPKLHLPPKGVDFPRRNVPR